MHSVQSNNVSGDERQVMNCRLAAWVVVSLHGEEVHGKWPNTRFDLRTFRALGTHADRCMATLGCSAQTETSSSYWLGTRGLYEHIRRLCKHVCIMCDLKWKYQKQVVQPSYSPCCTSGVLNPYGSCFNMPRVPSSYCNIITKLHWDPTFIPDLSRPSVLHVSESVSMRHFSQKKSTKIRPFCTLSLKIMHNISDVWITCPLRTLGTNYLF
jgi:hypothetical protein